MIAELDSFISVFREISVYIILIALLLALLNYFFRFLKWHFYLNVLKIKINFNESLLIFMSGLVMSVTPGKFGEVLKSAILKQRFNQPISRTTPIIFTERITDMISLVLIAAYGVITYEYGKYILLLTVFLLVLIILILTNKNIMNTLTEKLSRVQFFNKRLQGIININDSFWILLKPSRTFLMTMLSLFAWAAECIAFYLISIQINSQMTFELAAFIYSMATIIGSVMFLPGGLGGTEGTMVFMLSEFGFLKHEAVAVTTTIRIVTLWFAVLVGFLGFHFYQRKYGKIVL